MTITERDLLILEYLLTYGFLVAAQIKRKLFPKDRDCSQTRDRLRKLEGAGFVMRRRAEVANPLNSNTVPVWIITERGINQLALKRDDACYLAQKPPCCRSWQNFKHYVEVAEDMMTLRDAVAAQKRVKMHRMYFEHTVICEEADEPAKR